MIVSIFPPLVGEQSERFRAFAMRIADAQRTLNRTDMRCALIEELKWCHSRHNNQDFLAYEACIRVLSDLTNLRWRIIKQGYGFALENRKESVRSRNIAELMTSKEVLRHELKPVVEEQLRQPAVQNFISKMENDGILGQRSVRLLMADGEELAARLAPARKLEGEERMEALDSAIKPYLQKADETIDKTTGRRKREIWRYFRYSWSIPQVPTPGRQLLYLIRDSAHKDHPVIGIAALNNCPIEMGVKREQFIGWHFETVVERFTKASKYGKAALEEEVVWLEQQIVRSLSEIDWTNLVTAEEVASPDASVVSRLTRRSKEFSKSRKAMLMGVSSSSNDPLEPDLHADLGAPPIEKEILNLDAKGTSEAFMQAAIMQLVAKKRASALSRLLSARIVIANHRNDLTDPRYATATLEKHRVKSAVKVVLDALKGRRAGANLLEITTCGAIAPYNRILGGKLVALLMLSPRVGADYQRQYSSPSIISSQMKNRLVTRDNTLVYLGTTSLYVHGSSQYNRLKLPTGTIAPDQECIRFQAIGQTSGFGTIQFSPKTSRAIDAFLADKDDFKEVNSVFGEGTSPKLRKMQMGLHRLGFDASKLLRHQQHRLIYGAPLFPKAREWLQERVEELPRFVAKPKEFEDATERIVSFWRRRWLSSRLRHDSSMELLPKDDFVPLNETICKVMGENTE